MNYSDLKVERARDYFWGTQTSEGDERLRCKISRFVSSSQVKCLIFNDINSRRG